MTDIQRSYMRDVIRVLERCPYPVKVAGTTHGAHCSQPIFFVYAARGDGIPRPDVLLTGGVHAGNEPAGVYALLDFLDSEAEVYLDSFNFYVFPCINPFGFETISRENSHDLDINRSFHSLGAAQESRIVMDFLKQGPSEYLFAMDMHEAGGIDRDGSCEYILEMYTMQDGKRVLVSSDEFKATEEEAQKKADEMMRTDSPKLALTSQQPGFLRLESALHAELHKIPYEYFLYEICADKEIRVGQSIVTDVGRRYPVCRWESIMGDKNKEGVIWYPSEKPSFYAELHPFDMFLHGSYTRQAFTTETPIHWSIDDRVDAQLMTLRSALEHVPIRRSSRTADQPK